MNELMIILCVRINTKYRIFFFYRIFKNEFHGLYNFLANKYYSFQKYFSLISTISNISSIDNIFISHYKLFNFI